MSKKERREVSDMGKLERSDEWENEEIRKLVVINEHW